MFLVTNRAVNERTSDNPEEVLLSYPSAKGPNELRLVEAVKKAGQWKMTVLPDVIDDAMKTEISALRGKKVAGDEKMYASDYVAWKLLSTLNPRSIGQKKQGKNLLLFVHGYNNKVTDVLNRAEAMSKLYGVEVLPFTWPANGGGAHGIISYKSDKRDALASTGALDRTLAKIKVLLKSVNEANVEKIEAELNARFVEKRNQKNHTGVADAVSWDEGFFAKVQDMCPFTINMLAHSMGNYLFKHLLKSAMYRGNELIFDNIILAAADTNNEDHALWVNKIQCRKRLYITINENDSALRASRLKMGENQRARLGHYPKKLDAENANYIDFTDAALVGTSHAYFADDSTKNIAVKNFFSDVLNGYPGETKLEYDGANNTYKIP